MFMGEFGGDLRLVFVLADPARLAADFRHGRHGDGVTPMESLQVDHYNSAGNLGMLATYWALFTATGFLAAPAVMKSRARTTYLTLNNALFFALASLGS